MFYSPSNNGFYSTDIHGEKMPSDCVVISDSLYASLIDANARGKTITPDLNGKPIEADLLQPSEAQLLEILRIQKQSAYCNESDPLFFKAQRGEIPMQQWLDKVAEIKARF